MSSSKDECQICFEEVPEGGSVVCFCDYAACVDCVKKYLLTSTQNAHCMDCKAKWSSKFLEEHFEKKWLNGNKDGDYRAHMKQITLDRERSKIPETLAQLPKIKKDEELHGLVKDLNARKKEIHSELKEINEALRGIQERLRGETTSAAADEEKKIPHFICPCPQEDCRGMIDSKDFSCAVCQKKVCRKCREPREKGHECDEGAMENVKFIRKDTKPCPKCAAAIHKIEGCDQMWCTQCQTAFSWTTGKVETGTVHNPHAIEWQRQHGGIVRDINDIPCGGLVGVRDIYNVLDKHGQQLNPDVYPIHRSVGEVGQVLRTCTLNEDFDSLRKEYVLGKITEEKWKQAIFVRERNNNRKRAKADILVTYRTLATERFRDFAMTLQENTSEPPVEVCSECQALDGHLTSCSQFQRRAPVKANKRRVRKKSAAAAAAAADSLFSVDKVIKKFVKDMEEVRVFTNRSLKEELGILGTKKPLQLNDKWEWTCIKYNPGPAIIPGRQFGGVIPMYRIPEVGRGAEMAAGVADGMIPGLQMLFHGIFG